jgi:hypothetical protein
MHSLYTRLLVEDRGMVLDLEVAGPEEATRGNCTVEGQLKFNFHVLSPHRAQRRWHGLEPQVHQNLLHFSWSSQITVTFL